jgi:hypothetical protein
LTNLELVIAFTWQKQWKSFLEEPTFIPVHKEVIHVQEK